MFTSKKIGILALTILVTPILAGLYGIACNEVAYSLSSEYYTKFKFLQYDLDPSDPHIAILYVGWVSTWWTGLVIGIVLGGVGLIHKEKQMLKAVSESILLTLVIAFGIGILGLAIGGLFLPHGTGAWNLPEHLDNKKDFIAVGFMHSFGYVGGIIGLAASIIYQIRQKRRVQSKGYQPSDGNNAIQSRPAA